MRDITKIMVDGFAEGLSCSEIDVKVFEAFFEDAVEGIIADYATTDTVIESKTFEPLRYINLKINMSHLCSAEAKNEKLTYERLGRMIVEKLRTEGNMAKYRDLNADMILKTNDFKRL